MPRQQGTWDVDGLLSRLSERPRMWPAQQEWCLGELATLIERSDRLNLSAAANLKPAQAQTSQEAAQSLTFRVPLRRDRIRTALQKAGAARLLLELVHESIPPAAALGSDLEQQERVARQACRAIYLMVIDHTSLCTAAVEAGAIPLMVMVLTIAAEDETRKWAIAVTAALLRAADDALRAAAVAAGVAEAAVARLLAQPPASLAVQQWILEILAELVDGTSGAVACAAVRAGAVGAAAATLRRGGLPAPVQLPALALLTSVAERVRRRDGRRTRACAAAERRAPCTALRPGAPAARGPTHSLLLRRERHALRPSARAIPRPS